MQATPTTRRRAPDAKSLLRWLHRLHRPLAPIHVTDQLGGHWVETRARGARREYLLKGAQLPPDVHVVRIETERGATTRIELGRGAPLVSFIHATGWLGAPDAFEPEPGQDSGHPVVTGQRWVYPLASEERLSLVFREPEGRLIAIEVGRPGR